MMKSHWDWMLEEMVRPNLFPYRCPNAVNEPVRGVLFVCLAGGPFRNGSKLIFGKNVDGKSLWRTRWPSGFSNGIGPLTKRRCAFGWEVRKNEGRPRMIR